MKHQDLRLWNILYSIPNLSKQTLKQQEKEIAEELNCSLIQLKLKLFSFRLRRILKSDFSLTRNYYSPISDTILSYLISSASAPTIEIYLYLANKYVHNDRCFTDFELITKALKLPINKRSYELVTNITSSLQNQGLLTIKSTPDHIFTINLWNDEVIIK